MHVTPHVTRLIRPLALIAALATANLAFAGTCPDGKAAANPLADAATAPVGVTDTEIASIDLSKENVKLKERRLRMRLMVIAPGGIVPMHSHKDRPALIITVSGQITEHRSSCAVPIIHHAGEIAREADGISHWWSNEGAEPAVLLSSDVFHQQ